MSPSFSMFGFSRSTFAEANVFRTRFVSTVASVSALAELDLSCGPRAEDTQRRLGLSCCLLLYQPPLEDLKIYVRHRLRVDEPLLMECISSRRRLRPYIAAGTPESPAELKMESSVNPSSTAVVWWSLSWCRLRAGRSSLLAILTVQNIARRQNVSYADS